MDGTVMATIMSINPTCQQCGPPIIYLHHHPMLTQYLYIPLVLFSLGYLVCLSCPLCKCRKDAKGCLNAVYNSLYVFLIYKPVHYTQGHLGGSKRGQSVMAAMHESTCCLSGGVL